MSQGRHKLSRLHDSIHCDTNTFYALVSMPNKNGCMDWTGSKNAKGYGQISRYKQNPMLAHRFSYLLHYGEFDSELCVLHACDNPSCVAPKHLWLGTKADNMRDCSNKGRLKVPALSGDDNPSAKITNRAVYMIRMFLNQGIPIKEIASSYGVSVDTIQKIKSKPKWRKYESVNEYKPRII